MQKANLRREPRTLIHGLGWFLAWGACGLAAFIALGAAIPVGTIVMSPVIAGFLLLVSRRRVRVWPEIIGLANAPVPLFLARAFAVYGQNYRCTDANYRAATCYGSAEVFRWPAGMVLTTLLLYLACFFMIRDRAGVVSR